MNIDFLKPVLGDELFAQVSEKLEGAQGITLVNSADGSYVPKAKFNEANNSVKTLTQQVQTLTQELETAKAAAGNVDELNQQITKLQQDVADRDGKIESIGVDYDVKDIIRGAKARDVDIVFGLIDRSKVKRGKDGKLQGVDDQIKAVKDSKAFLFEDEKGSKGGFDGQQDIIGGKADGGVNAAMNNAIRASFGVR